MELFTAEAETIFGELDQATTWDAVMCKAPTAGRELGDDELDRVLGGCGGLRGPQVAVHLGPLTGRRRACGCLGQRIGCEHSDRTPDWA